MTTTMMRLPARRRLAVNLMAMDERGGSFGAILDTARIADRLRVDRLVLPDHVSMNKTAHRNRAGFPYPLTVNWHEPLTALAAVAAVTEHTRLGTNVLIAPLRPATLLAKQIATLDEISSGRVDASFGVGWQAEEYSAGERPFDTKFGVLEEQIEACRALWGGDDAQYRGRRVRFDETWSRPLPPQGSGIPIYLGIGLSSRNLERIHRLADGWAPAPMPATELRESIARLRSFSDRGAAMHVTAATTLHPHGTFIADRGQVVAEAQALWEAGADTVIVQPHAFCRTVEDLEDFLTPLLAARDA